MDDVIRIKAKQRRYLDKNRDETKRRLEEDVSGSRRYKRFRCEESVGKHWRDAVGAGGLLIEKGALLRNRSNLWKRMFCEGVLGIGCSTFCLYNKKRLAEIVAELVN